MVQTLNRLRYNNYNHNITNHHFIPICKQKWKCSLSPVKIMWKCHKCGKPVYFAERKQSLGYNWHPECLRCEECGKRLNPGQHAEHKGVPYCHVPCYGALFGPQLFGHGTRVESHTSFGKVENKAATPNMPRAHLETKLKLFNQYYDGRSGEIRSREVNGRLVLEGTLRIYWGVVSMIHLKEDDDQRTVVTIRKRNSVRSGIYNGYDVNSEVSKNSNHAEPQAPEENSSTVNHAATDVVDEAVNNAVDNSVDNSVDKSADSECKSVTLPSKLDIKQINWDELDELLQVERQTEDGDKLYQTMPSPLPSKISSLKQGESNTNGNGTDDLNKSSETTPLSDEHKSSDRYSKNFEDDIGDTALDSNETPVSQENFNTLTDSSDEEDMNESNQEVHSVRPIRAGSTAIRRRPGRRRAGFRAKLKRRCSINGHFYNRETSFFTPPFGSQMSVWVTSLVSTQEVINLMLDKYKVDSKPHNFALFVVRDNGEQRRLKDDEYPLLVRVMLGPHEEVAKLYLMDAHTTDEISCDVAQFLNLSSVECTAILARYYAEEKREIAKIEAKFAEMKRRMKQRMSQLKVRL
ncbi:uncharacterized protein [Bemisia tabaci]|uniref:uncharacterized protein isoform X1 n=2 Tax=Bemisia tabaci TaxID=7038 RepID=UPI003B27FD15